MNYLRGGLGTSRPRDEAGEMSRPLTPREERPLYTLGILQQSLQNVQGLCKAGRKCVRRDGHANNCWPK